MKEHIAEAIHELCNMGRGLLEQPQTPENTQQTLNLFNIIDNLVAGSTIQRRAKRGPKEKGGSK